jgi:pimeloyl-ACP methyl ester carboxylesterase
VLSSAHPLYRDLASHLAAQGLAVLRYDPRCSATDACTLPHSLHDYSDDVRGGLLYLRARPEIDPNRVFVLGHNEGGILAASAVAHVEDEKIPVAGLVLISTPGRVYSKLARERARRRLSEEGRPPAEIEDYLTRLERLTSEIATGRFTFENERIDPQDRLQAWLINRARLYFHLLSDDPLQIVRQVRSPVLILQGEQDIYVGTRDAQYLEEALKRQYHRDLTLRLLPQVDHWLQTSRGETTLKTDAEKSRPLDPGALGALTEWFERQVKTGPKSLCLRRRFIIWYSIATG